jgi:hypothetical protein
MLGGLLTILAMAVVDGLHQRTGDALHKLVFVLVTGTSCALMTGLPEVLLPALPAQLVMLIKAGLGPTAGALALFFLANWHGGIREGIWVHRVTVWGGGALLGAAMLLALVAAQLPTERFVDLLWLVAAVNLVPAALAVVLRSAVQRDLP